MRFFLLFLFALLPIKASACIPTPVWSEDKAEQAKKSKYIGLFKIMDITHIPENDGFYGMLRYQLETLANYKDNNMPDVFYVYERDRCYLPERLKYGVYDLAIYEDEFDKRLYSIQGFSMTHQGVVENILPSLRESFVEEIPKLNKAICQEIGGVWKNIPVDSAISFNLICEYENSIEESKPLPDAGDFCKHDAECLGKCLDTLQETEQQEILLEFYKEFKRTEKSDQWVKPDYCINVEPIEYDFNLCGRYDPITWEQFLENTKAGVCSKYLIPKELCVKDIHGVEYNCNTETEGKN